MYVMGKNIQYQIAKRIAVFHDIALDAASEGAYGTDDASIISILSELLGLKYTLDMSYRSFADRVNGPWRDALVAHWQEHAKEERDSAYDIAMKIYGMGGDPTVPMLNIPEVPPYLEALCQSLIDLELLTVAKARQLIDVCGDNTSMRVFAEDIILVDTQHIDDLRRMCTNISK